jgi:hypothetical protein
MTQDTDRIEALLRSRRVSAVAEDGFSDTLLERVPARSTRGGRWPIPTFSALGGALAALALANTRIPLDLAPLFQTQGIAIVAGAAALLVWTTCAWALVSARQ